MGKGTLYLIPTTLGRVDPRQTIPLGVHDVLEEVDELIVESEGEAMRFLGRLGLKRPLGEIALRRCDRETKPSEIPLLLAGLEEGRKVGIMSDAGSPGIADPGADLVRFAHDRGVRVVPLVGPSSLLLALMSSGANAQSFVFHGYLPQERPRRLDAIREMERDLDAHGRTQLFIEAPHRNDHLLEDLVTSLKEATRLSVAVDLTLPTEQVRSAPISAWRATPLSIGKRPAIYVVYR